MPISRNEYARQWYRKNSEKVIAYQKKRYKIRRATEPGYKNYRNDTRRAYCKKYYANNENDRNRHRKIYESKKEILNELKSKPCTDCKIQYPPYVMEFDHRNPKTKLFPISRVGFYSIEKLKIELEKCDLVCANCHKVRTHKQRLAGFFKKQGFGEKEADKLSGVPIQEELKFGIV